MPSERPHGRAKYVAEGCGCLPCRADNANYEATRNRLRAYGRPTTDLVDAGPARAHVHALRAAGMGRRAVADAAGVTASTVERLLGLGGYTPSARLRPETARKILAVRASPAHVDAAPTWRLIRGMVARGYPKSWIAGQLGAANGALQLHQTQVSAANAAAVAELAERCALAPGPSARARAYAAARGWTADLLWQDLARGAP